MGAETRTFTPVANPFQNVGVYSVVLLLFVLYSRIFDVVLSNLHVTTICYLIVIATSVLGGALTTSFSSKIGFFILAFSAWLLIDVPFSVWKGGSFYLVAEGYPKSLMVFIAVAGLPATLEHCKKIMSTIAYAIAVVALITLLIGDSTQGRLFTANGKFANPNDLAQALLIGLPFWWFMARNPTKTPFRVVIPLAGIGLILFVFSKTGSRGGIMALVVMLLVVFWNASAAGKVNLLLLCVLGGVLGAFILPKNLVNRYVTLIQDDPEPFTTVGDANSMQKIASESTESRIAILRESIKLTIRHPIFGVGPGMFEVASAEDAASRGERGMWLGTHNSYTQVSSEAGLPALAFYVGLILTCLSQTTAIYRLFKGRKDPRQEEIAAAAFCIRASMIAFAITACFSHVAYQAFLPGLAGLCAAFIRCARSDVDMLRAGQAAPVWKPAAVRVRQPGRIAPAFPPPVGRQPQAKRYV